MVRKPQPLAGLHLFHVTAQTILARAGFRTRKIRCTRCGRVTAQTDGGVGLPARIGFGMRTMTAQTVQSTSFATLGPIHAMRLLLKTLALAESD